jgi:hypothetical protein
LVAEEAAVHTITDHQIHGLALKFFTEDGLAGVSLSSKRNELLAGFFLL